MMKMIKRLIIKTKNEILWRKTKNDNTMTSMDLVWNDVAYRPRWKE